MQFLFTLLVLLFGSKSNFRCKHPMDLSWQTNSLAIAQRTLRKAAVRVDHSAGQVQVLRGVHEPLFVHSFLNNQFTKVRNHFEISPDNGFQTYMLGPRTISIDKSLGTILAFALAFGLRLCGSNLCLRAGFRLCFSIGSLRSLSLVLLSRRQSGPGTAGGHD